MASKTVRVWTGNSASSKDTKLYTSLSSINTAINNAGLPNNCIITSVKLKVNAGYKGGISPKVYMTFGLGNTSEFKVTLFSRAQISNGGTYPSNGVEIINYFADKAGPGFALNLANYGSYFVVRLDTTYITRLTLKVNWVDVDITYEIPTYTITTKVSPEGAGTVTGGGSYERNKEVKLTATPIKGYEFVQWSDGNIAASRSITATSNMTFIAEFAPLTFEVTVESSEGLNGVKATVSGGGQYKYGDTITIKADIPPYHNLAYWRCSTPTGVLNYYDNPLTITINEDFLNDKNTSSSIAFYCTLDFSGYTLKANVSPDNSGAVEWGHMQLDSNNDSYFFSEGVIPYEGILVLNRQGTLISTLVIRAVPIEGYEFVQWSDGEIANPRETNLNGDATFTAILKKKTFKIRYLNYDDSILQEIIVEYGDPQPPYTGPTPTKPPTDEYEYEFLDWDSFVSEVTYDFDIKAYYKSYKLYEVIVTASPEIGGVVTGSGKYRANTSAILTATPSIGYRFVNWSTGSISNPVTINVSEKTQIVAYFEKLKLKIKSVKIYYPTEVNVASPNNPLISGEQAQIVVKIGME